MRISHCLVEIRYLVLLLYSQLTTSSINILTSASSDIGVYPLTFQVSRESIDLVAFRIQECRKLNRVVLD